MPGQGRAAALGQQPKRSSRCAATPRTPKGLDAGGRELDRQRNPVELVGRCRRRSGHRRRSARTRRGSPPRARQTAERPGNVSASAAVSPADAGGTPQRRQAVHVLALGAQRLAAGRQDVHPRCASEDPVGQSGGVIDDVLAVVEHQQHPLVLQEGDQAGERIFGADFEAEHGSQRSSARAEDRRAAPDRSATRRAHRPGSAPRPRRGRPWSCRSPPGPTIVSKRWRGNRAASLADGIGAADHSRQVGRQIVHALLVGCLRSRGHLDSPSA